jgi:hypothetical protein
MSAARAAAAAVALLALLLPGCASISPFCEEQGAYGSWSDPQIYAGLRALANQDGGQVHFQGGGGAGVPLAFDDPAFAAATQGDGTIRYVVWDTGGRHYILRGEGEAARNGSAVAQPVSLEVDRMAGEFDAEEAGRFLAALTALPPGDREALVAAWLGSEVLYGRLHRLDADVPLNLTAFYRSLPHGEGVPDRVAVADGPWAGSWLFPFEKGLVTWSHLGREGHFWAMVDSSGFVQWSYGRDGPPSPGPFKEQAAAELADAGLGPTGFAGFRFREPVQCLLH